MRTLVNLALLSILGAAPVAASCHDSSGNLLAANNCGFDKDAQGWTASPGAAVSQDPADHGVLNAVADSGGSLTIVGPCVAAQPKTPYRIGARLRSTTGTSYFCSVNAYQYSDDRCTEGAEPLGSAAGPPSAEWATLDGSATTSEAAKSLQLHPSCSGEPGFTVQLDDFVVSKM
jgi:hypothetical protein